MKSHSSAKALLVSCAAIAALAVMPTNAAAQETFFQFGQLSPSSKIFNYTNLFGPFDAQLSGFGSVVMLPDFGGLALPSLGTISLNALAAAPVQLDGTQDFSGSIVFTLTAPQLGLSGLSTHALTVNFTGATFTANHESATLSADDDTGATISYLSDFAVFGGGNKDFALSFSGANPALTLVGGRLPDSHFSGSGTFAYAVPEPESWALMAVGFGLLGASMRKRRQMVAFS